MKNLIYLILTVVILNCSACVSIEESQPIGKSAIEYGITPVHALPKILPKNLVHFEDSPFVFVHADKTSEFMLGLAVPIPFVSDAVTNSVKKHRSLQDKEHYINIDVFSMLSDKYQKHPNFKAGGGGYKLYPMVVFEECYDEVYRLSLLFQVEHKDWMSRYYYHLPTPIPVDNFKAPTEKALAIFKRELDVGADQLMRVIDMSLTDQLQEMGQTATVGSLYIVGGKLGGIVSPLTMKYKGGHVLLEEPNQILIRLSGDIKGDAKAGGMAYGVHLFQKDQLHTFEEE